MERFRDRIIELRRVKASKLLPSPKNWRTHPRFQRQVLEGLLSEVGIAAAAVARELPDGSLELIDGHLRQEILQDDEVPVLVLDVTEEEAEKLMLTMDPVTGLAGSDPKALDALLQSVDFHSAEANVLLEQLAHETDKQLKETLRPEPCDLPEMELQPYEHYDYVIVLARNRQDWNWLCERLGLERVDASVIAGKKKIGLGRAIGASRLIDLLQSKPSNNDADQP
jgi:hypothetical protein